MKLYTLKLTIDEVRTLIDTLEAEIDIMKDVLKDTEDRETERETIKYLSTMRALKFKLLILIKAMPKK